MKTCKVLVFLPSLALLAILPGRDLPSAEWRVEWESTLAAARKEGKVVIGSTIGSGTIWKINAYP